MSPDSIATPTTLLGARIVFAAPQRGQVHEYSSIGPSGVRLSVRTFAYF
jgi:hypothetical protein